MKRIQVHPPITVKPFTDGGVADCFSHAAYVKALFLSPKWNTLPGLRAALKIENAFAKGEDFVLVEDADFVILKEVVEEFFPFGPPYVAKQLLPFVDAICDAKENP